jgi:ADP-dependent NAD(P)H-hydrate dehydratase
VLVVGGEIELAGAVMLAGVAALRAGAGKLQVAVAEQAVVGLSVAMPEARVFALPQTPTGA